LSGRSEGMGQDTKPLTWEEIDRVRAAYADASICCRCGAELKPGGPVWKLECILGLDHRFARLGQVLGGFVSATGGSRR
jgi:hypothetical protein